MLRANFEAVTKLKALKKNALQLCGQDFIDSLTVKGLYAKDDSFWLEVNKHLKIPNDAYQQEQARAKLEREQKLAEETAREKAEIERLLANKKEISTKIRNGWKITIFEFAETDKDGNKFIAEYSKEPDLKRTTCFSKTSSSVYGQACNLIDDFERKQKELRRFIEHYQVMKPLYLMLIYLSGCDEHNPDIGTSNEDHLLDRENFTGISFWNGFDFKIVNYLELEGLLELSTTRKTLTMTKKGMKSARDILQIINLDGVETLLEQRQYHEDYINFKSRIDIMREED